MSYRIFFFILVLGIPPMALYMLWKYFITELTPSLVLILFIHLFCQSFTL